jgi:carbon monoxide dehydrogenase subunit G
MASEKFHRQLLLTADSDRCWQVLTDVDELASWVTVVHDVREVTRLERYSAVLQDRLGPLKLRADLDVRVDVREAGRHLQVRASGRDPQVNSQIAVDATLLLVPVEGGTELETSGSYQVVGRVASMGGGIIRKKADHILEQFVTNAQRTLGSDARADA